LNLPKGGRETEPFDTRTDQFYGHPLSRKVLGKRGEKGTKKKSDHGRKNSGEGLSRKNAKELKKRKRRKRGMERDV